MSEPAAGGVAVRGTLFYTNTLIANNPKGGDCVLGSNGLIQASVFNLVEDGSCNPAYSGDPLLDKLADNSGDTQTRGLLAGSPALDAIPTSACTISIDQRGQPRPGITTFPNDWCDIGAFESQGE
jgi:hypothetical protein